MASAVAGTAAGMGGSVGASIGNYDTDDAVFLTVTAGTTSLTTGVLATITFAQSWASNLSGESNVNPKVAITAGCVLGGTPVNAMALGVIGYSWSSNKQSLSLYTNTAPSSGLVYCFSVIVQQ